MPGIVRGSGAKYKSSLHLPRLLNNPGRSVSRDHQSLPDTRGLMAGLSVVQSVSRDRYALLRVVCRLW
ncbi:hypothetical protein RRG08_007697 [Elysia crispata]|uniref:Uncharacterized protein n=1 Tax=Elysia crispata TaxID=231223 RepID=A0AAE0YTB9_9GAST|nr:hypothetical protein RRG08_007697 [Elysia crispata]